MSASRKNEGAVAGAQSIRRAVAVLRAVSEGGREGVRMSDVAKTCGLHAATAHRTLAALEEEGLLIYLRDRKTYLLGPAMLRMGARAEGQQVMVERYRGLLDAVAEASEDTVFLSVPSGYKAVCLARVEGRFPIRTMSLEQGSVRPLGIGAGSLALCAFLPDEEREAAIVRNAELYPDFGVDEGRVRWMVERSRKLGYALNDGRILDNVTGIGVPLRDEDQGIVAAISVAAISARMTPERISQVVSIIRDLCDSETGRARK